MAGFFYSYAPVTQVKNKKLLFDINLSMYRTPDSYHPIVPIEAV